VILVVALIFLSCANAFEFTNLLEVKQLRKTNYGNSLIETISLTLQNSGKIEEVTSLLTDLAYKLNKDQEDADSEWKTKKQELQDTIDGLTTDIETLRVDIVNIENRIAELQTLIDQSNTNIAQYNTQYAENVATIKELADNRAKDEAEYAQSVSEHNDLINAIEQVISELQKLQGSISGVGKPSHVQEIDQETRDREYALQSSFIQVTKNKKSATKFAQMAVKADQAGLKALIGLLNDLLESTKASLNADTQHESDSAAAEATLSANLSNDNASLQTLLTDQNAHLTAYTSEQQEQQTTLGQKQDEKSRKETELAATIQEMADRQKQYDDDTAERASELAVIQKLQKIVNDRLANMSSFLRSDVN